MDFNVLLKYQRFFYFNSVEREAWLELYRRYCAIP